jgi:hypothetical protein
VPQLLFLFYGMNKAPSGVSTLMLALFCKYSISRWQQVPLAQ